MRDRGAKAKKVSEIFPPGQPSPEKSTESLRRSVPLRSASEGKLNWRHGNKKAGYLCPIRKKVLEQIRCSLSEILAELIGHDRRGPHG